jgi:hypothetical protein
LFSVVVFDEFAGEVGDQVRVAVEPCVVELLGISDCLFRAVEHWGLAVRLERGGAEGWNFHGVRDDALAIFPAVHAVHTRFVRGCEPVRFGI